MKNDIQIAMIADEEYLLPIVVAIRSLLDKVNKDHIYTIYLIMSEKCQKEMQRHFQLVCPENVNVQYIIPSEKISDREFVHSYVTKTALYKFCLGELLQQCDKVLYIDGDILVYSDLVKLFEIDIKDYYAAVVKDMPSYIWGNIDELGLQDYFNSGVMLLNLKKMRDDNVKDKLFWYKKHEIRNIYMDQDAFNVVFANQVKFISPIYNFISACFKCGTKQDLQKFYDINDEDLDNIEIEHFAGSIKPWKDASSGNLLEWFPYLDSDREVAQCIHNYYVSIIQKQNKMIEKYDKQLQESNEHIQSCEMKIIQLEQKITELDNILFIRMWRKIRGHRS